MMLKKIIWLGFMIFLIPIIIVQGYNVYVELLNLDICFHNVGNFILIFELFLASVTAFKENGHFPIRYLLIFMVSAFIFYLALNKSDLEWYMILVYIVSIVILSLTYVLIKILNNKYQLSD